MNDIFLVIRALKEVVSEPHWYDVDCIDEGYRAALRLEELKPVAWITKGGEGELWWERSVDENGNDNLNDVPLYALEQS